MSRRKVKCSKLFTKIFGFEGMIGRKNFKRSKKKYRTTVISLFVSIVLFISASSLGHYLIGSIEGIYKIGAYEISYTSYVTEDSTKETDIIDKLKNTKYVLQAGTARVINYTQAIEASNCTQEYLDYQQQQESATENQNPTRSSCVYGVEDEIYKEYLQKNGLSVEKYMDNENPIFLIYANCRQMDSKTGKTKEIPVYKQGEMQLTLYDVDWKKYNALVEVLEQQNPVMQKENVTESEWKEKEELYLQAEKESRKYLTLNAEVTDSVPFTVNTSQLRSNIDILLCSRSMLDHMQIEEEEICFKTFFKTTDHMAALEEMQKVLKENNMSYQYSLVDDAMEYESTRSMIYVIKVFSYGFLVMMSLIAMANVFNTISTNMLLRRREFAMLKSVGLTSHSFNKMLYYECIMYGSKALVLGIPVSLVVVWWIYRSINDLWVTGFVIPWMAIFICFVSVYSIVFITMIYSKKKIQKLNLIVCIKEENI